MQFLSDAIKLQETLSTYFCSLKKKKGFGGSLIDVAVEKSTGSCLSPVYMLPQSLGTNISSISSLDLYIVFSYMQNPNENLKSGPNFGTEVKYRKLPDGEFVTVTVPNGDNKYEIDNAGENTKYEVIVRAKNDEGTGPESKAVVTSSGGGRLRIHSIYLSHIQGKACFSVSRFIS